VQQAEDGNQDKMGLLYNKIEGYEQDLQLAYDKASQLRKDNEKLN